MILEFLGLTACLLGVALGQPAKFDLHNDIQFPPLVPNQGKYLNLHLKCKGREAYWIPDRPVILHTSISCID
jgi:hypothetical protein